MRAANSADDVSRSLSGQSLPLVESGRGLSTKSAPCGCGVEYRDGSMVRGGGLVPVRGWWCAEHAPGEEYEVRNITGGGSYAS